MTHLFEPLLLRGVSLRNRIGVSPMCQYSAKDGLANDWHLVHLGSRAVGGAGLVIVEATAVEARGMISPNDLGIWNDTQIAPLARIAQFLREHGAVAGIQLAHAGRKAGTASPWHGGKPLSDAQGGWNVVGPSALAFGEGFRRPHELSVNEIEGIVESFRNATVRTHEAGFQLIELHAAHGYLLHSFLSPLANKREDEYGGSFENRCRIVIEIVRAIRGSWPAELPLAVRLSATDWVDNGWKVEDSAALAAKLGPDGVDLIDCSSGGAVPGITIPNGPGYQVPLAEHVRRKSGVATAAVGMISAPTHADEIIRNCRADLVLLGRESLRDPYWPVRAARTLGQPEPVPNQYARAF